MIALIVICIVSFISNTNCLQTTYYRLTPKHGISVGRSSNNFTCPGNGAITNIYYYYNKYIMSLQFVCSSPAGITSFGPYGPSTGTTDSFDCPKGQYISSMYGNAGDFISHLGVRCRRVTEDLKGSGTDLKKVVHGSDTREWPPFDDFAYANGARPIGAKIWNSVEVEAIQFTYANTPVELCTDNTNCTDYREENSQSYGGIDFSDAKLSVFQCPRGGAVTSIKTKIYRSKKITWVTALQFGCTSGVGTTFTEVFGQDFGTDASVVTIECPPGLIVGSIHGHYSIYLHAIGIRCVVYGTKGESPKYEAQGGPFRTAFDDAEYSNKGWRPVQFRVYHGSQGVYEIQVKYGNAKVATNCQVTKIVVTDSSVQAKSDGFEVIGITTDLSCSNRTQVLKLDYTQQLTEELTVSVDKGGDFNYAAEMYVSVTRDLTVVKATPTITVKTGGSYGVSNQWSSSKETATSISTGQLSGTEITYKTPGACIIIGYIERYKIDLDEVNVLFSYDCEGGGMSSEAGKISLRSKSYGNAHFDDYQMKFTDVDQCTDDVRACLKKLDGSRASFNGTTVLAEFKACFRNGTGEIN